MYLWLICLIEKEKRQSLCLQKVEMLSRLVGDTTRRNRAKLAMNMHDTKHLARGIMNTHYRKHLAKGTMNLHGLKHLVKGTMHKHALQKTHN